MPASYILKTLLWYIFIADAGGYTQIPHIFFWYFKSRIRNPSDKKRAEKKAGESERIKFIHLRI
jgi:hypothetical protein